MPDMLAALTALEAWERDATAKHPRWIAFECDDDQWYWSVGEWIFNDGGGAASFAEAVSAAAARIQQPMIVTEADIAAWAEGDEKAERMGL